MVQNETDSQTLRTTELIVEVTFEAAHQLVWHSGKCRKVHGHSYRAEVAVAGSLDHNGIVADFADVKAAIAKAAVNDYDHVFLNEVLDNPTAERLAHDMVDRLVAAGLNVVDLRLWETRTCSVRVRRGTPTGD